MRIFTPALPSEKSNHSARTARDWPPPFRIDGKVTIKKRPSVDSVSSREQM
jgi:hypothetical protein